MSITMGVVLANRGFFSDELCLKARNKLLPVLKKMDISPVILPETGKRYGSVQTIEDARKCAELFRKNNEAIKGIIVSLPNFGEEKAIAESIRKSNLDVPVLIHAFPDETKKMNYENRRDSLCGKISVCNNLRQYGFDFSLTKTHNLSPESEEFKKEIIKFKGICRVVDKLSKARIGVIGTRPADFNTVRFSEKLLENNGISIEPIGLMDIVKRIDEVEQGAINKSLQEIKSYIPSAAVPEDKLRKMAGLLTVIRNWINSNELDAFAIQCWDALPKYLGITPCSVMSMFSNSKIPAACEADVMGAVSMLALQAAADAPSALVDWNNNFDEDKNKLVVFHCGNFAREIYSGCQMRYAEILGASLGNQNTQGSIYGQIKPGRVTFARISTDDNSGKIKAYLAEGEVKQDDLDINGSWGAVEVEGLQDLLRYICENGFEHHVAINLSSVSGVLMEAFEKYLKWNVFKQN